MSSVITKNLKRDTGEHKFCLLERKNYRKEIIIINNFHRTHTVGVSFVRVLIFVFCRGIPLKVVTTPLVCIDRMFASLWYRNSTVFDSTSGTEQMQLSNKCEILWRFCGITD